MERLNIAVIGGGPAGVSAAITAKARNQNVLLLAGGISEKVRKAHGILNYPGLPEVSGQAFAEALEEHLRRMEVPTSREQVTMVYDMGEYFAIQTSGEMYEAEAVILATGVVNGKPLPGENEFLGRGVSYCATCDANFYRGKTVAVLGYNDESKEETEFLATVAEKVYFLPGPGKQNITFSEENITVLVQKPKAVQGAMKVTALETDLETIPVDGVFILKDAISPDKLVPGLTLDGPHVVVNLQMETNLPGLFACGDVAGKPYQYIKSAGQGNVAALSAVNYLTIKKHQKG